MYIAGRSEEKAEAAISKLTEELGRDCEVYFLEIDLADIPSIGKVAQELSTKEHRLDILINNAALTVKGGTVSPEYFARFEDYPDEERKAA